MAYDEGLAQRIRDALDDQLGVSEKKMFGGIAFMINGNMSVGVVDEKLMVRGGPDTWDEWLSQPGVDKMDFTGRPMKGWIWVHGSVLDDEETIRLWVSRGRDFACSLPAKPEKETRFG